MKKIIYFFVTIITITLSFNACQEDDVDLGGIIAPTNVTLDANIICEDCDDLVGDGSGKVIFTATADNVITYNFNFGDGFTETNTNGVATHRFSVTGENSYTIVVNAVGTGGVTTSTSVTIVVYSAFEDVEAKDFLSGGMGNNKIWYWDATQPENIGLGPNDVQPGNEHTWPFWFSSFAWHEDKLCMYDAQFIFSQTANGELTFEQTEGIAYIPGEFAASISVDGNTCHGDDVVSSLNGVKNVSLVPSSSTATIDGEYRGTTLNFSDEGFMCWYVGVYSIEIIEITEDKLSVRMLDASNPANAWYCTYTTSDPNDEGFTSEYNNLVWFDEFDTNGAPDPANWGYDLGQGIWGTGDVQTYTDDSNNVIVQDGSLIITAINDGGDYTSARLKSENLYEFTYGRVEVRAKLPVSQGTWPAIWMLGANNDTVGWPDSGEIDIMEQTGQDKNTILGTCHWFDSGTNANASYGETTALPTATSEFHNYTVEWKSDEILILVDDQVYFTLTNDGSLPFNSDFFLILNVAMGGDLGGTIDPGFTQDTMEIDYVRVYQ